MDTSIRNGELRRSRGEETDQTKFCYKLSLVLARSHLSSVFIVWVAESHPAWFSQLADPITITVLFSFAPSVADTAVAGVVTSTCQTLTPNELTMRDVPPVSVRCAVKALEIGRHKSEM
jgi:hypothetical protein